MRIKAVFVTLILVLTVTLGSCAPRSVTITDKEGKEVTAVCYRELAIKEAAEIISRLFETDVTAAKKRILSGKYRVETFFDATVYDAIKSTAQSAQFLTTDSGVAATDNAGHLIATYSSDGEKDLSTVKTMPYSAFKPLSVYSPAIEDGIISWSSTYLDAPVKTVNGQPWPTNADYTYVEEEVTVQYAVARSLNTVAVQVLDDYGVEKSMDFLTQKFNIDLTFERQKLNSSDEQEIVGNVALGSIQGGVSPVDMAGFYSAFANSGEYIKPVAVKSITDKNGKVIYTQSPQPQTVFSPETAYIMNKLLQTAVQKGGTAQEAAVEGIEIAGKTGTGSLGNWFVGVTPQYSVAVWHGKQQPSNVADVFFSQVLSQLQCDKTLSFPSCSGVKQLPYCMRSGLLANTRCTPKTAGFYKSAPSFCPIHR